MFVLLIWLHLGHVHTDAFTVLELGASGFGGAVFGRAVPQEVHVLFVSLFLKSQLGQYQSAIVITPLL